VEKQCLRYYYTKNRYKGSRAIKEYLDYNQSFLADVKKFKHFRLAACDLVIFFMLKFGISSSFFGFLLLPAINQCLNIKTVLVIENSQ